MILVIVAGYLIINNIFKISVNEDIKLLGLLKTIGMTKPQIKKLVHLESLAVALPAIIVGDIVGISIGKVILNKIFANNEMLTDVKLSFTIIILIILFSTAFTYGYTVEKFIGYCMIEKDKALEGKKVEIKTKAGSP